jgi:hypothetical protein
MIDKPKNYANPATATSLRKYWMRRRSILLKVITSSIWPKIPAAIVVWAEPVSVAR